MDDKYTYKQVCDILGDKDFSNLLQYVLHMFGTMPRSMTEEEIIQYLKMNRKIGIPLGFMPTEVQEWCNKNSLSLQIVIENRNIWDDYKNWVIGKKLEFTSIVCLSEDYEYHATKLNGEWIEFEIDDEGDFAFYLSKISKKDFHWYEWQRFLFECHDDNHKMFTAFGGWQYADDKRWYLVPAVKLHGKYWNSYVIEESEDATPVIPVKIRFWKEYK